MLSSEAIDAISKAFSVFFMGKNFIRLVMGLLVTIQIAAVSVLLSLFFGTLFGMLMTVKNRFIKALCKIYLEFMRIMPQLVLLFMAYYGLTRTFGISLSGEAASVLVFCRDGRPGARRASVGACPSVRQRHGYWPYRQADIPLYYSSPDSAAAGASLHEPGHQNDKDYIAGGFCRGDRSSQDRAADHRRESAYCSYLLHCSVCSDFLYVFFRVLDIFPYGLYN